jgi:hypothetical protein
MDAKSGAFVAWAKLSNPTGMGADEVKKYLASSGVNIYEVADEKPSSKRGPLEVGEVVHVDGSKCLHPENQKNCARLALNPNDPIFCIVVDIIEPKDPKEMATIRVSPINNKTGKVEGKKYDFKAVYPKRIAGLTKKLNKLKETISNLEVEIPKLREELEKASAGGDKKTVDKIKKRLNKGEQTLLKAEKELPVEEKKAHETLRVKSLSPHDGVGLYRSFYSSLKAYQKSLVVEETPAEKFIVVYERGSNKKVPQLRKEFNDKNNIDKTRLMLDEGDIEDLIDTGIKDLVSLFYSGPIKSGSHNKKGEFYFSMEGHQDNDLPTSINPSLGTVYFISKVSDMSRGTAWLSDLRARLKAQAELEFKQLL